MHKKIILIILISFLIVFSIENAFSQSFSIKGNGGLAIPSKGLKDFYKIGPIIGGSFSYYLYDNLIININSSYLFFKDYIDDYEYLSIERKMSIIPITIYGGINPIYQDTFEKPKIRFYLIGGGGLFIIKSYDNLKFNTGTYYEFEREYIDKDKKWGILGGFLFEIDINKRTGIYLESNYNYIFDREISFFNIIGGIAIYFGDIDNDFF